MKALLVLLGFVILPGCQAFNTSTGDEVKYGGDGTPFSEAKVVFATQCSSCHDFHNKSEEELAAAGLYVRGDLFSSPIFSRIKGAGLGDVEDMPEGSQISAQDLNKIRLWIEH